MQFKFARRKGRVWHLKPTLDSYQVGLSATGAGIIIGGLALAIGGGSTGSAIIAALFFGLAIFGIYRLGTGATVRVDFAAREITTPERRIAFDEVCAVWVDAVFTTESEDTADMEWRRIFVLTGDAGCEYLARSDAGGVSLDSQPPEQAGQLLAISSELAMVDKVAKKLSELLEVRLST